MYHLLNIDKKKVKMIKFKIELDITPYLLDSYIVAILNADRMQRDGASHILLAGM